MRILVAPLFLVASAACAPLAGNSAAQAADRICLDLDRVVARRPEGPRTILFETAGARWRNTLPQACPGLERPNTFTTLVFEPKTGPLCRNDFVRVADSNQLGTFGPASFPRCRLGGFTRVPPVPQ